MSPLAVQTGLALRSADGLHACGDAAVIATAGAVTLLAVIDALGHGPDAERSAKLAAAAVEARAGLPLQEVFEAVGRVLDDPALRGVVMSAVRLEGDAATFAGVGNVEIFAPPGVSRPATMTGTLGRGRWRYRECALEVQAGQRWVLGSDGLKPREVGPVLETLREASPSEAAAALIARASRLNDDACALVLDLVAAP